MESLLLFRVTGETLALSADFHISTTFLPLAPLPISTSGSDDVTSRLNNVTSGLTGNSIESSKIHGSYIFFSIDHTAPSLSASQFVFCFLKLNYLFPHTATIIQLLYGRSACFALCSASIFGRIESILWFNACTRLGKSENSTCSRRSRHLCFINTVDTDVIYIFRAR